MWWSLLILPLYSVLSVMTSCSCVCVCVHPFVSAWVRACVGAWARGRVGAWVRGCVRILKKVNVKVCPWVKTIKKSGAWIGAQLTILCSINRKLISGDYKEIGVRFLCSV